MSASDLDVADRTKFDKVTGFNKSLKEMSLPPKRVDVRFAEVLFLSWQIFEQVLSELEPLCLAEQDFISKFFKLQPLAVQPPLAQVDHLK